MHFQKRVMMKKLMKKIKSKLKYKKLKVNPNKYKMTMKIAVIKKQMNKKMKK